ncbi:MAG: hypothetical protein IJ575_00890 [Selenomonadaceae bacterium]|nr:hypothetical protein [Selenomonadaceae bacterium]
MNLKKVFGLILGASILFSNGISSAAENLDVNQPQNFDSEQSVELEGVVYESQRYGYRMICPKQPSIVPASFMYEDRKGDLLIFDYDNDDITQIKYAWLVTVDAFDTKKVIDFNKANDKKFNEYLEQLKNSNGFETAVQLQLPNNNKGVFAVTAKEVEIDEDGDGIIDDTATADHQEIVVFFRSDKNRAFSIQLIQLPEIDENAFQYFKLGVSTFEDTTN